MPVSSSTLPAPSLVTAVNAGVVAPSTTDCDVGEMVTLPTGAGDTVSVAPGLVSPSLDAVIVVVPGATPVATPVLASMVATDASLDAKVIARPLSTLPLASFATAVNAGVVE